MMTPEEEGLLARIAAFRFDDGSPKLSFAARLARDNGWRRLYALRVIEEYRKFAFLMVASGHMAIPSDQVDQVWHLHLLYTRSWADFGRCVLRRQIHHEPSRGGDFERERFRLGYERTLESYRRFFGEPPEDIWPDSRLRFGRDTHHRRVNTRNNLVIPRSRLIEFGAASCVVLGAVILVLLS